MLCLVDLVEAARAVQRKRFKRAAAKEQGFQTTPDVLLGMRAMRLTVQTAPGMKTEKIARIINDAAVHMRLCRVDRVLFADSFPHRALFEAEGYCEADYRSLMGHLAPAIAERVSREKKCAALFARHFTTGTRQTLLELCRIFRTVMLFTDSGNGAVCARFVRQLGVSILINPSAGQLKNAGAAVFIDPPEDDIVLPEKTVAVPAGAGALSGVRYAVAVQDVEIELPSELKDSLPEGFKPAPIAAAALDCGTLARESVTLGHIRLMRVPPPTGG